MPTVSDHLPPVVSRERWLKARKELLEREKALTKERDRLNAERRGLPMVRIEKDYLFEGPDGMLKLADLFEGRRQLIVYHFMFAPGWTAGCSGCSAWADHLASGHIDHLHQNDTSLALISRAPLETIAPFKSTKGWTFPWYSSYDSDFNYDFGVTIDERVATPVYNYRTKAEHERIGTDSYPRDEQPIERPGLSCFLRDDDTVYHTYSTYGRGVEQVGGAYHFLDLTVLGRQEKWEERPGRGTVPTEAEDPK